MAAPEAVEKQSPKIRFFRSGHFFREYLFFVFTKFFREDLFFVYEIFREYLILLVALQGPL